MKEDSIRDTTYMQTRASVSRDKIKEAKLK